MKQLLRNIITAGLIVFVIPTYGDDASFKTLLDGTSAVGWQFRQDEEGTSARIFPNVPLEGIIRLSDASESLSVKIWQRFDASSIESSPATSDYAIEMNAAFFSDNPIYRWLDTPDANDTLVHAAFGFWSEGIHGRSVMIAWVTRMVDGNLQRQLVAGGLTSTNIETDSPTVEDWETLAVIATYDYEDDQFHRYRIEKSEYTISIFVDDKKLLGDLDLMTFPPGSTALNDLSIGLLATTFVESRAAFLIDEIRYTYQVPVK